MADALCQKASSLVGRHTLIPITELNALSNGLESSRVTIIPSADHSPNYEEPEVVARVIRTQA